MKDRLHLWSKSLEDRKWSGNIPFRVFGPEFAAERARSRGKPPLPIIGAREHGELVGRARKARPESLVFHEHLSE